MKTKSRFNPIFPVALAGLLIVWAACKKDNNASSSSASDQDSTVSLSTSSSTAQAAYGDVFNEVMSTSSSNNLNTSGQASRVQTLGVTVGISPNDTGTYPKTLTIDFGTGDTSLNGVIRTGKLIVTLSGHLIDPGTTVSVTFDQYTVNGFALGGTYSFTNNSTIGGGLSFTTLISGGSLTYPSGAVYTYAEQDTLVQTSGVGTPSFLDDAYSITGNFSATSPAGNSISAEVTTPLVTEFTCGNIVSGVVSFTYDKLVHGSLDYGNGTCDNQATLTVGAKVTPVTLP